MTIIGIGTDIVAIKRIKAIVSSYRGDRFARRILSPDEWLLYKKHNYPVRFIAKRFAVKEAASKAFGTGFRDGLYFSQFEVCNDALGKPKLRLFSKSAVLSRQLGVTGMYVTLADEKYYAYAAVIIERE